jgi:hypothetical protein
MYTSSEPQTTARVPLRPLNFDFMGHSLGFSFISNKNTESFNKYDDFSLITNKSSRGESKLPPIPISPLSFEEETLITPNSEQKETDKKCDYIYCFLVELNYCNYYLLQTRYPENSIDIQKHLENQLVELFDSMDFFVKRIKPLCILNSSLEPLVKNIPHKFFEKEKMKDNIIKLIDNIVFFNNSCSHLLDIFKPSDSDNANKIINKNYLVYNEETNVFKIFKEQSMDLKYILKPLETFYIIPCDDLMNSSVSSNVLELLDNKTFSNREILVKLYESLMELQKTIVEKISEIKSNEPLDDEETRVKTWLTSNYELSDNIEYRIKAATLSELIEGVLNIEPSSKLSFRNRLSKYLVNLGLHKKRFGDGFYYYGLKKISSRSSQLNNSKITNLTIEDLMKQRETSIVDLLAPK